MKKHYFLLIALFAWSAQLTAKSFVRLTNKVLHTIDKTGIFNEVDIQNCFAVCHCINDILKPLKGIVEKLADNGTTDDEKATLLIDLQKLKVQFMDFTQPLLKAAEENRHINHQLVIEWAEQTGHNNSLLLTWGQVEEGALLANATAQEFLVFLKDLRHFLHSMIASCPIAREKYKVSHVAKEQWTRFETLFNQ